MMEKWSLPHVGENLPPQSRDQPHGADSEVYCWYVSAVTVKWVADPLLRTKDHGMSSTARLPCHKGSKPHNGLWTLKSTMSMKGLGNCNKLRSAGEMAASGGRYREHTIMPTPPVPFRGPQPAVTSTGSLGHAQISYAPTLPLHQGVTMYSVL